VGREERGQWGGEGQWGGGLGGIGWAAVGGGEGVRG